MKDLVLLVADKNIRATLEGLLGRPHALGIRPVTFDLFVHPRCDPGCFHEGAAFLASRRQGYGRGVLVFDRAWGVAPATDAEELRTKAEGRLAAAGLAGWAAAVVLDPELEAWVFSDSPHVGRALGWEGRSPDLWDWLRGQGLLHPSTMKPADPKGAVEALLWEVRKPRSSATYRDLAGTVSLARCTNPAFTRLRQIFQSWFPPEATP